MCTVGDHLELACCVILWEMTVMETVNKGHVKNKQLWRGSTVHKFPQRWLVYFTLTEKLLGTMRFRTSAEFL